MKTRHLLASISLQLFMSVFTCSAATTVLVDFGSNNSNRGRSVSGPDSNGNYWNSVDGNTWFSLVSTANVSAGINLGYEGTPPFDTDSYNGPAGNVTTYPDLDAALNAVAIDSAALGVLGGSKAAAFDYIEGDGGVFHIWGLNSTDSYNFAFFGSKQYSSAVTSVYEVFTTNPVVNPAASALVSATLKVRDGAVADAHNQAFVAEILNLQTSTGSFYVRIDGDGGGTGILNAMSIQIIPEPSAATLLALGSAALFALRRRS